MQNKFLTKHLGVVLRCTKITSSDLKKQNSLIMLLKCISSFIVVVTLTSLVQGGPATTNPSRMLKSFPSRFGFPFGLDLAVSKCGIRFLRCPANCAIDPVLIHGFCCGCPGFYDDLPVHCPYDIICPFHPEPLCPDFYYLLDCCC